MKKDSSVFRNCLSSEDVFVLDRGFRDCLQLLETFDLISKMPNFLKEGCQHTWDQANKSRLVTKICWVVEAVNGLIKKWKAFDQTFPNSEVTYISQYVRIICAICNAFRPPRVSNNPDDILTAQKMLRLVSKPNMLQQIIEAEDWASKTGGCCAHIASVLWYLGYYRHLDLSDLNKHSASMYGRHVKDAAVSPDSEDQENDYDWINAIDSE